MKKLILLFILIIMSCTTEPIVEGCTVNSACNYNADAEKDNGSCEYAMGRYDCDGNCIVETDCSGECGGSAIVDYAGNCYPTGFCAEDIFDWYGMQSYEAYICSIDVNSTDPDATQSGNCICQCRYGTGQVGYDNNTSPCDSVTTSLITLINSYCWWPEQCYSYCESYCINTHIECPTPCL